MTINGSCTMIGCGDAVVMDQSEIIGNNSRKDDCYFRLHFPVCLRHSQELRAELEALEREWQEKHGNV